MVNIEDINNNNDNDNEQFIIELGESFKEILRGKDSKINEIRSNIIDERFEVMRLFILLRQLTDTIGDMETFLSIEEILNKLKEIKNEMRNFIISFMISDVDLILE